MITVTAILVTIAGGLVGYWVWGNRRGPGNLPPGPTGWPLLGSVGEVSRDLHLDFMRLGQQYGEVFSFFVGNSLVVVLNSYRAIREALMKRGVEFADRPKLLSFDFIKFNDAIVHSHFSTQWKSDKKFAVHALRNFGFGTPQIEGTVQAEIEAVLQHFRSRDGQVVDVRRWVARANVNVIASIIYNGHYDLEDPECDRLIEMVRNWFNSRTNHSIVLELLPPRISRLVYSHVYAEMKKCRQVMKEFMFQKIKEHEMTFDPDNIRDLTDAYLAELRDSVEGNEDDILTNTVLLFFPDPIDTVSTMFEWIMLYMLLYEDVQNKIYEEICYVTGGSRQVALEDRTSLPYTEATVYEALRHSNFAPLSAAHKPVGDTQFDGFTIPQDSDVIANFYAVHMDPEIWGDPENFRPEHFLTEDGKLTNTEACVSFGMGRRMCMGEPLARMELFLFLANLIQRFSFDLPEGALRPTLIPEKIGQFIRRPCEYEVVINSR